MTYMLSHFAILPSGEFLVSGYDQLNSAARLVFLDASGNIIRSIDLPAARTDPNATLQYGSHDSLMVSSHLMGTVAFTPYNQDIIVWHMGSSDPILDVGPGASVREVPIQPPPGFVFVDMIPSTDRLVAHFRSTSVGEGVPLNQTSYAYYELRPQDASLSAKLTQTGEIPLSIACEADGTYIAFKRDKNGKLVLLKGD